MLCVLCRFHRSLAICSCSFLHSIAVRIPSDRGFGFVNFNTFFGMLGCWLGWRVERDASKSFFKGVSNGVVGEIDKVSEMSSSRGSIPLWCEHSVCVFKDLGEVVGVVIVGRGRGHVRVNE